MKHDLGQYFTTNIELKEKILEFIFNEPLTILEPSIGQGDLITFISDKMPNIKFDMYEIDTKIKLLDKIQKDNVIYCDFLKQIITKKYKTIIGNPPYIRTKKGNLYIDFIQKCYNLLYDDGELIFIVPSDFLKLTSSSNLLNDMLKNGTFTHIYHPHNEKMFENAYIDIIVFRYYKNNLIDKKVLYNDKLLYIRNCNGLITFEEEENTYITIFENYFDIYVGLVSGKEEIYKNEKIGNIEVINGENKIDKYIYIQKYPCDNDNINNYLLEHKNELINRKIRKFNDNNWFEWGAPRNISTIHYNLGKDCIYIYNLTRKKKVAFLGKVNYFGGGLIMLIPKKDYNLHNIILYINSNKFTDNFIFSGRFKIGHRQLSNSYIPNELVKDVSNKENDLEIEEISKSFSLLEINENKIITIQKWFRGCIIRLHQMPLIIYKIQKYLQNISYKCSTDTLDGRINSYIDEDKIIELLIEKFCEKIKKPKIRMWYDILLYDYMYGWIPCNIKTTTTLNSDNTGNLAMCLYSYTNEKLDIHRDRTYDNGSISDLLFTNLKNKNYNTNNKKDYYFIVINKKNPNDIIVNSIKGLTELTPNINNLPFQVCWNKNRKYKYENIKKKVKLFINCLKKPKPSWKENFMSNIRLLDNI